MKILHRIAISALPNARTNKTGAARPGASGDKHGGAPGRYRADGDAG